MDSIEKKSLTQSRFQLGTPLVLPLAMLLIVIIISVAFVLYATAHGVGITPDSVSYASSAQSFASSFSFTQFDGLPLTLFPPGFPAVLGVFLALGLSFQFTAVLVGVLALVALLIFTFAVGRGLSRSMWRGAFAAAGAVDHKQLAELSEKHLGKLSAAASGGLTKFDPAVFVGSDKRIRFDSMGVR